MKSLLVFAILFKSMPCHAISHIVPKLKFSISPVWPPKTCCLPAEPSVGFHYRFHFGGITFTIWFRLGYFAVYASPSWLPGKAQDSLFGGAGCSFRSRTFTCKISAAFTAHSPMELKRTPVK